ncbi:uncharacterized protein LOC130713840 [Lotus japonicus]|uniref:uncharacterized protein LOC130713840 n=1 Tax=Lotus japonicus TaxID=34305 RepID=UPI00258CCB5F|nr:uncharacterized protein LOC130713840 [Lotus japonicus]
MLWVRRTKRLAAKLKNRRKRADVENKDVIGLKLQFRKEIGKGDGESSMELDLRTSLREELEELWMTRRIESGVGLEPWVRELTVIGLSLHKDFRNLYLRFRVGSDAIAFLRFPDVEIVGSMSDSWCHCIIGFLLSCFYWLGFVVGSMHDIFWKYI